MSAGPRINILELHRSIQDKARRKAECFDRVLQGCHHRIRVATDCKQLRCVYAIPEFMPGFPIYDIAACAEHVQNALCANGFCVKRLSPRHLYVSWDFDEMKGRDHRPPAIGTKDDATVVEAGPALDLSLTSSLTSNNHKAGRNRALASLSRKASGKLTLSLT